MKTFYVIAVLFFAVSANAQTTQTTTDPLHGLSSNPWGDVSSTGTVKTERTTTPWNDKSFYPTPPTDQYIGGKTTWNTAMGQEEIAPEVNVHNMVVMTRHLESLGYDIPEGFEEGIRNSPEAYHEKIMAALSKMSTDNNEPVSRMSSNFIKIFEDQTGFKMDNLIGNSFNIIRGQ